MGRQVTSAGEFTAIGFRLLPFTRVQSVVLGIFNQLVCHSTELRRYLQSIRFPSRTVNSTLNMSPSVMERRE
jgi:hypothetical protein